MTNTGKKKAQHDKSPQDEPERKRRDRHRNRDDSGDEPLPRRAGGYQSSVKGKWSRDGRDRTRTPSRSPAPPKRQGESPRAPAQRSSGSAPSLDGNALLQRIADNQDNLGQQVKAVETNLGQQLQALNESIGARLGLAEEKLEEHAAQLSDHEAKLLALSNRLEAVEVEAKRWKEEACLLAARMSKAEVAEPISRDVRGSWDREADPTKLKVNASKLFTKKALQNTIAEVCERGRFDPKLLAVTGATLSKRFFIQFLGAGQIPVENLEAFMRLLKDEDDEWIPLHVLDPSNAQLQIYVSRDKSPKLEKLEILTKKLGNICKTVLDESQVYVLRSEGIVKYQWQPLLCVVLPNPTTVQLQWNAATVDSLGGIKDEITKQFNEGARAGVQWCP